jgi:hypothetical protein
MVFEMVAWMDAGKVDGMDSGKVALWAAWWDDVSAVDWVVSWGSESVAWKASPPDIEWV